MIPLIHSQTFRYGIGCFETLKVLLPNKIAFLPEHISRLLYGAEICLLKQKNSENQEIYTNQVKRFITQQNYQHDQIMRLILTAETDLEIFTEPYLVELINNNPLKLKTSLKWLIESTSPLNTFKSFNYLNKYLAFKEAQKEGFDDSLLLNEKLEIVETSKANIFLRQTDNTWLTPHREAGCLPGIIRKTLIPFLKARECPITLDMLKKTKQVIITNSLIEVKTVSQIDNMLFDLLSDSEINTIKKYFFQKAFNIENK